MWKAKQNWQGVTISGLAILLSLPLRAEEVAPFRVTSVDGEVSVRYFFDEQMSGTSGSTKSGETRSTVEEEVFIRTKAYVYHPNLLKVELGGGPLLVQSDVASGGVSNSSQDTLYNLTTRLDFLEKKPYPFSIYYEHLNPSVYTSTTSRFLQENNKVGASAALRHKDSPVNMSLDVFQAKSEGDGIDQIVDEETDQAALRIDHSLGKGNNGQLLYQTNKQTSRSGLKTVTIIPTTSYTDTVSHNSKFLIGKSNNLNLSNAISFIDQRFVNSSGTEQRKDLRITPDLRWRHSDKADSFYQLNYADSEDNGIMSYSRMFSAGLNHRPDETRNRGLDLRIEDNRTEGFSYTAFGAGLNINKVRSTELGPLRLSYGARYDRRDQTATLTQIPVSAEYLTLSSSYGVALEHNNAVISTIVVKSEDGSVTYTENTHYYVIPLGVRTEILAAPILDGQKVRVSYEYKTGGTLDYSMFGQNAQASWTIRKNYIVYTQINNTATTVHTGTPTIPLNSGTNWGTGASANVPLKNDMRVGGEVVYDDYRENIYPYIRNSIEAYVETPLPSLSTLRLSARQVQVDNIGSSEDVNLRGFMLRLRSRPWFRANLTVEASFEEDTGSSLPRKISSASSNLSWRFRRLLLGAEAKFSRENQGTYERDRSLVRFYVVREIL